MPLQQPSGLNATRQMLDDLDALMERMLSLPMDEAGGNISAPPAPPKRPALAATLTVLDPMEQTASEKPAPALHGPHVNFPPAAAHDVEEPAAKIAGPAEERVQTLEPEVPGPLVIRRLDTVVTPESAPQVRTTSFVFWRPLLWINEGFDQATRLLGPFGALLRSSPGRWLLGLAGLTLFGLAAAWLIQDLITWTW